MTINVRWKVDKHENKLPFILYNLIKCIKQAWAIVVNNSVKKF